MRYRTNCNHPSLCCCLLMAAALLLTSCSSGSDSVSPEVSPGATTEEALEDTGSAQQENVDDEVNEIPNQNPAETPDSDSVQLPDLSANQPHDLRGITYTYTEIELFWTNPAGSSAVRWEVARNGEIVATVPGPSFYESGLQELTQYRYRITPLDAHGQRGPFVESILQTPANAPVITPDSAYSLSLLVMQQLSMTSLASHLGKIQQVYYTLFPNAPYDGNITCPSGGNAAAVRTPFEHGVTAGGVALTFDQCVIGTDRWNGSINFSQQSYAGQTTDDGQLGSCTTAFSDLTLNEANALPVELTGTLIGRGELHLGTEFIGRFVQRLEPGSVILDANLDIGLSSGQFASGSYTFQNQQTGNRPLSVSLLENMRISTSDNRFDEGVVEVKDPLGGVMTITIGRQGGALRWKIVTHTSLGQSEQVYLAENGPMPELKPWPVGTDCHLVYPSGGILLDQNGDFPTVSSTDPFAPDNLQQSLDTIFSIQQARWVEQAFHGIDGLASLAESRGGTVTEIPSSEALLLDEVSGTYQQTNSETGIEETVEFVVFRVDEKIVHCPQGGKIRVAYLLAGMEVFSRGLSDQCVIDDTIYSGEVNLNGKKYDSRATLSHYRRIDDSTRLELENAKTSYAGALGLQERTATRVVHEEKGGPVVTVENFDAAYNQHDSSSNDYDRRYSVVSAQVQLGDGQWMYELTTVGKLQNLPDVDVSTQGKLLATSVDGSTLTITPGNGDNESFDVSVQNTAGYDYVQRMPYTDHRYFRIK